jgi:hypothetical protein
MFLNFSTAFVLSSIAVLCSGQESTRLLANSKGITAPEFRFVEWNDMSEGNQAVAEDGLGYAETTWNTPGTSLVEYVKWSSLNVFNQGAAITLGFSEETWNCYMNHYLGLSWEALAYEEVQQYYVTLGWTEDSWEGDGDSPESNDVLFNELNAEEKAAAEELCYDENLWDEESLPFESLPLESLPLESLPSSGRRTASTLVVFATAINVAVVGTLFV